MATNSRKRRKVTEPRRFYLNSQAEESLLRFVGRYQAASQSEAIRTVLKELDEIYQAIEAGASIYGIFSDAKKNRILLTPRA